MQPEPVAGSVRLDHTLLAVENEHTVNVMLELAAPSTGCHYTSRQARRRRR